MFLTFQETSEYETEILLTIHHLNASDFGSYKCVCENYIGKVHGSITLNGKLSANWSSLRDILLNVSMETRTGVAR